MKWLIFAFLMVYSASVHAQAIGDYEPDNEDWTGLSDFVSLAEERGVHLRVVDSLQLATLEPDEPLLIFYPKQPLKTRDLTRFVVDGGRILLADDFGLSDEFLTRLEIERFVPSVENLPNDVFYKGNPATPLFKPRGKHALLGGVRRLVANHPSVIVNEGGPVVAFRDGSGLVYDMNLGDGKVIVVSDPSIFINQMLPIADNREFALNALSYLCRDQPQCRATLVTKSFDQVGVYASNNPLDGDLGKNIEQLNAFFEDLTDEIGTEFLYFLSLFLLVGLGVYLVAILPLIETRKYSGYISDFVDSVPPPQSEFDWNISRFSSSNKATNDVLPMAILKQIFEEIFLSEFELWPSKSEDRPQIEKLARMFSDRFLIGLESDLIERDLTELLAVLAKTPSRHRVFLENETDLHRGDLMKYHRIAIEILTIMGKKDEYERRTWGSP